MAERKTPRKSPTKTPVPPAEEHEAQAAAVEVAPEEIELGPSEADEILARLFGNAELAKVLGVHVHMDWRIAHAHLVMDPEHTHDGPSVSALPLRTLEGEEAPNPWSEAVQGKVDVATMEAQVAQARNLMAIYKGEYALNRAGLEVTNQQGQPRSQEAIFRSIREARTIIDTFKAMREQIESGEIDCMPEPQFGPRLEVATPTEMERVKQEIDELTGIGQTTPRLPSQR